jgi:hypothetical protein
MHELERPRFGWSGTPRRRQLLQQGEELVGFAPEIRYRDARASSTITTSQGLVMAVTAAFF